MSFFSLRGVSVNQSHGSFCNETMGEATVGLDESIAVLHAEIPNITANTTAIFLMVCIGFISRPILYKDWPVLNLSSASNISDFVNLPCLFILKC